MALPVQAGWSVVVWFPGVSERLHFRMHECNGVSLLSICSCLYLLSSQVMQPEALFERRTALYMLDMGPGTPTCLLTTKQNPLTCVPALLDLCRSVTLPARTQKSLASTRYEGVAYVQLPLGRSVGGDPMASGREAGRSFRTHTVVCLFCCIPLRECPQFICAALPHDLY